MTDQNIADSAGNPEGLTGTTQLRETFGVGNLKVPVLR